MKNMKADRNNVHASFDFEQLIFTLSVIGALAFAVAFVAVTNASVQHVLDHTQLAVRHLPLALGMGSVICAAIGIAEKTADHFLH